MTPRTLLLALLALLVLAAPATAATPVAVTGPARAVEPTGARLTGTVDANGEATSYAFEYGTTRRYGTRTRDLSAGRSFSPRTVATTVDGLRPNTVYHYRIVASNASGVRSGVNRTFRTAPQPLGLSITGTPNPVTFNFPATIAGQMTGTGAAGRQVVLERRAFPYTGGFSTVAGPVATDAGGNYAFPQPAVPATAQYRVSTAAAPLVRSPIFTLGVAVRVKTNVDTTRPRRGALVRFSGTIRPARPGSRYAIQKQTSAGSWVTVAGATTRSGGESFAGFSKRIRVSRGGSYRVFVQIVDGDLTSGVGRTVRLSTR